MTNFMTVAKVSRLVLMLAAGAFLLTATEDALAKNGNNSSDQSGIKVAKAEHKDKDDYKDKNKHRKDKDKHKDKTAHKGKDKDKGKGTGTGTTGTGTGTGTTGTGTGTGSGTGTGTGASNGGSPPAAPIGDPVVRDHRPGGNAAGPTPGTIIRDHRNGADGKPVVVVSSSNGVTVTRPATDDDLRKAGLLPPKPAPSPVQVPIGGLGGGR
jgi:hypothetical protein